MPIDWVALTAITLGCLMFLIPIMGLTARFTIKPIVEAIKAAREGTADRDTIVMLERRMALLEQEVHGLTEVRADLTRLLEEMEFQKQLTKPK